MLSPYFINLQSCFDDNSKCHNLYKNLKMVSLWEMHSNKSTNILFRRLFNGLEVSIVCPYKTDQLGIPISVSQVFKLEPWLVYISEFCTMRHVKKTQKKPKHLFSHILSSSDQYFSLCHRNISYFNKWAHFAVHSQKDPLFCDLLLKEGSCLRYTFICSAWWHFYYFQLVNCSNSIGQIPI